MEPFGMLNRWIVAFPFLRNDMEDDRLISIPCEFQVMRQEGKIVSIDRSEIADSVLLENGRGNDNAFPAFLGILSDLQQLFASRYFLKESPYIVMESIVQGVRYQLIKVFRNRSDVFRDRPLIVIQNDHEPLRRSGYIIELLPW